MPRVPIYPRNRVKPSAISDLRQRVRVDPSEAGGDLGLGSLGRGLSELGAGLEASERQRAAQEEQARFLAAEREAERLESSLFHPEEGFLAFEGAEAARRRAAALKDYEAGMEKLQAGLITPRLSSLWEQVASGRQAAVRARLAEEGLKQTTNWLQGEQELRLEQRLARATANVDKPERQSSDLELLTFDAEVYARSLGFDDAESDAFVKQKLGTVHEAALSQLLADGQLDEAAAYLEEQRETLPADLARELDGALGDERRLANAKALAEDLTTTALADSGDGAAAVEAALTRVESIEDEETRGIVRRQLEATRRASGSLVRPDPERQAALDALQSEAYEAVRAGGNPDELSPDLRQALGRERLGRLRRLFEQGPSVEDDWARYGELAALPPADLAVRDLFAEEASLTPDRFSLLRERQERARQALAAGADSAAAAALASRDRRRQILLGSLNLDPKSAEAGRIAASLDQAVLEAERAKGKPLEQAEEARALQEGALAALPKSTDLPDARDDPSALNRLAEAMPDLSDEERRALYRSLNEIGGA